MGGVHTEGNSHAPGRESSAGNVSMAPKEEDTAPAESAESGPLTGGTGRLLGKRQSCSKPKQEMSLTPTLTPG